MKTFAVVLMLAATVPAVTAAPCMPWGYSKYNGAEFTANNDACAAATKYQLLPPSAKPTDQQLVAMCSVPACNKLVAQVQAADPKDCSYLDVLNLSKINMKKFVKNYYKTCWGIVVNEPTGSPQPQPNIRVPTQQPPVQNPPTQNPPTQNPPVQKPQ